MINFIKKLFGEKTKFTQKKLSAICPYCKKELLQRPQRKKRCPFCKNYIFVKGYPNSEIKELVTEEKAKEIEIEWNKFYNHNALIKDLGDYGFTEKEFIQRKEAKIKNGEKNPSNGDTIWSLFNEKVHETMKTNNFSLLSSIYYNMARFLIKEGKNPYEMLKQSQKMQLLDYKQKGLESVEISWSGNGCEACKKLDRKKYSIEKAIKEMPLPNKECSMDVFEKGHSWCRCIYMPVVE